MTPQEAFATLSGNRSRVSFATGWPLDRKVLPEDEKCPTCHHYLSYDDGAYYCDCTHGETFNCRCPDALKRYVREEEA